MTAKKSKKSEAAEEPTTVATSDLAQELVRDGEDVGQVEIRLNTMVWAAGGTLNHKALAPAEAENFRKLYESNRGQGVYGL